MAIDEREVGKMDSARNPISGVAMELSVAEIRASRLNPRKTFDQDALHELADSLREQGMIEPIVIRKLGDGYEIIAGERRWRAAEMAGLETVPVRVLSDIDDRRALELALVENLVRRDINPIEEAEGFAKLRELGWKVEEIAARVGRDESTISNRTRLLELPEGVREKISQGVLSASMGKALLQYAKVPKVMDALTKLAEAGATTKAIEKCSESELGSQAFRKIPHKTLQEWAGCKFDTATCNGCNMRRDRVTCLDEECFDRKNKEALELKKQEAESASAGLADNEILISGLAIRADFTYLQSGLAGCRPDCEHRKIGVNTNGTKGEVCTDPKCHQQLEEAERTDAEARRRDVKNGILARSLELMAEPENASRIAAVGLYRAFNQMGAASLSPIAKKLGLDLDWKRICDYGYHAKDVWPILDALSTAPMDRLVELLALTVLTDDAKTLSYNRTDGKRFNHWLQGEKLEDAGPVCYECSALINKDSPDRMERGGLVFCGQACLGEHLENPVNRPVAPVIEAPDLDLIAYEDEDGETYIVCSTADDREAAFGVGTWQGDKWDWCYYHDDHLDFDDTVQPALMGLIELAEEFGWTKKTLSEVEHLNDAVPVGQQPTTCKSCGADLSNVSAIVKHEGQEFCSPGCAEGWQINQDRSLAEPGPAQEQACIQNCDECSVGCKCKGAFPSTPPPAPDAPADFTPVVYLDAEVGGHELYVGVNPDSRGNDDKFTVLCRWADRVDESKPVWERELGRSVIHPAEFATVAEAQAYLDSEAQRMGYAVKSDSIKDSAGQTEAAQTDCSAPKTETIAIGQVRRHGDSGTDEEIVAVVTAVGNLGDRLMPTLRYLANSAKPEEVGREFSQTVFNDPPGLERFNSCWILMSISEQQYLASLPQSDKEQTAADEPTDEGTLGQDPAPPCSEERKTQVGFEDRTDSDVKVYSVGPNPAAKGTDNSYCVLIRTYPAAYSNPMFEISSEARPSLRWNDAFPTEKEAQDYLEEIAAKNNWQWVEIPFGQAPQETAGAGN